ncbi:hypothetical protein KCH_43850 [Kitasatospora cheerisanensis KCTC 2395]|uniref:Uncharacterized protein n=2 Tax=Kitasatospora cheerisanensis TaxID=81942 RepID=A0A066Z086_9ACTN|nr:hypothetical protein KCH_43850 [Kitasatospora cheerisanensis KCTC 2395]
MAGGSWWREDGSADGADSGESVYVPAQAPPPPAPAVPPPPTVPPQPAAPPVGFDKPRLPPADLLPPGPSPDEVDRAARWAEGRGRADVTSVFPGWTEVYFDLPTEEPEPTAAPSRSRNPSPCPSRNPRRAAPRPRQAGPAPAVRQAATGPRGRAGSPARGPAGGGARRPAPLLLLGALLLVGGAVVGNLLVMLLGWGLAYLSSGLSDLMKKFAVLGIPLLTVSGLTLWNWGREKGRWGAALAPGTDAGHATWAAAPGVLRIAAGLTALFLLAVTLRRRRS